jgi:hypothetical protein
MEVGAGNRGTGSSPGGYVSRMCSGPQTELPNGLPTRRIPIEGTRAVNVQVAFEAGALAGGSEWQPNGIEAAGQPC